MPDRPASSLSASDGAAIRPLSEKHHELLKKLLFVRDNQVFAGSMAIASPGFVGTLRAEPWASPMLLEDGNEPVGAALVAAGDQQNRNGRLVVLAHDPARCHGALALYLRSVFWSHPIHRLYAVIPAKLPQSRGYAGLLTACGFVAEGSLVDHLVAQRRVYDLDVFGLLRREFDAWCETNQPGWALG
ncbi:MAG: hypothetical protein QOE92_10 [Chloroflexota bacterium]|jgi:hypothetical protein|nr:hypothetical protein [Chloroflexota bacterium]